MNTFEEHRKQGRIDAESGKFSTQRYADEKFLEHKAYSEGFEEREIELEAAPVRIKLSKAWGFGGQTV